MQINRLFGIVYYLLGKGAATAAELAKHFEVSERTILRDVDTLSAAGIPVYTSQGKGGGIALMEHYVLNKAAISDEEQNQILLALQSLPATGQTDTGQILAKLRSLFNKIDTDWIEVDFSGWGNRKHEKERFETLKQAILKRQAVRFVYSGSNGATTERSVYPFKLVFKSKAWYLQGYCLSKQDFRTFKIIRMSAVETTPETFADREMRPPSIEANETLSRSSVRMQMTFLPQAAYRVCDEFDEDYVTKREDGSLFVEIDLPEDDWLYGFLLSYGTSVRVLEPQSVKDRLLAMAERIKEFYSGGKT
jgi:predicted DNA-binding transcriptional regulator YafY